MALGVTFGSLILAVTCSTGQHPPAPPAPPPAAPPPAAPPPAAAVAPPLPAAALDSSAQTDPPPAPTREDSPALPPEADRPPEHALSRFHAALRELSRGSRRGHVRIAWLGDSHAMADFWTGAVRSALQKRFGNAGPGFVHAGYKEYRHNAVRFHITSTWRKTPRNPATSLRTADGIFGLGGALLTAQDGGAKAALTLVDADLGAPDPAGSPDMDPPASAQAPDGGSPVQPGAAAPPKMHWDVCYRLNTARDELTLSVGTSREIVKATANEPPGSLRHVILPSEGPATLTVLPTQGFPDLCGVIIETDPETRPGVVLDTLGINGARFTTPLAWDETTWSSELARRNPDLVVIEYGTNESGDVNVKPATYGKHLHALVDRVRRAAPGADCIALSPTDRADIGDRPALVRDAIRDAAKEAGCTFWDTYEAMGGKGSITAWSSETPPRAARDGIHLTWKGYRELGAALTHELLRGFRP
jgi:lysophospholipase L1-like esterase